MGRASGGRAAVVTEQTADQTFSDLTGCRVLRHRLRNAFRNQGATSHRSKQGDRAARCPIRRVVFQELAHLGLSHVYHLHQSRQLRSLSLDAEYVALHSRILLRQVVRLTRLFLASLAYVQDLGIKPDGATLIALMNGPYLLSDRCLPVS